MTLALDGHKHYISLGNSMMVLGIEPRPPEPQTGVCTINNTAFIAQRDD